MRTEHRADDVVRRAHVCDPVADRFVDRVLERAAAARHRHDFRAEEAHAEDVELLPRHVHLAHVDDALQPEERAGGGGGDAVLSRAGLRDDARLSHPLRDQRLPHRVVDLVRAGVIEVLALEEQPSHPADLREFLRLGERRRTSDEIGEDAVELFAELTVAPHFFVRRLELVERGHQGLGNELAAEFAEETAAVWKCRHRLILSKSRSSFAWSLIPGADSTPLARSMASGRTRLIAAATLSGVMPPVSRNGFVRE